MKVADTVPGEGIELRACGLHINTLRRPRKALPAPPESECLANQSDQVEGTRYKEQRHAGVRFRQEVER